MFYFFFFKQKTAYEMRISDWSSDVCSSDLTPSDIAAWALGFLLLDGKMRGLFSILFGASMLLIIDRAEASGQDAGSVHYRRMEWLAVLDRESVVSGKSLLDRVGLGGRRFFKNKNNLLSINLY